MSCHPKSPEFDLQEISCDSNKLYPELSSDSTYYEENPLYSEISEPHIECYKSTKTKQTSSPVEIHEQSTQDIDLPPISWHNYDSVPKILNVINTGRTILINGQWAKNRPYITGGPLNGNYIFSQIHFHSPSEHEINGKRYPLEMHVVHYKTSYLTQERAMEEKDGTVVIVYLFQVLNSRESVLSSITNSINLIERVNDKMELTDIALNQILQPVVSNYYIYWGSVSTSKNSYSLQWIISCSNLCVTQNEVDKLERILCSNESFANSHASQMNIINNVIYHVEEEDCDCPIEVNCNDCSDVLPKCYCRYHCQRCKICTVHKDEYLHFHSVESHPCDLKEFDDQDETFVCERTSKATSKSLLTNLKQKKKGKKNAKTAVKSSNSSMNSNSQSSGCEDEKKTKNENDVPEMLSSSQVDKTSNSYNSSSQKHINFAEPGTSSSRSTKNASKINFFIEKNNSEENVQDTKSNKVVQKSETGIYNTSKNSSKISVKNSAQNKKKITKNTLNNIKSSDSKLNKSNKKEKQKDKLKSKKKEELQNGKQKKKDECPESSEGNSKNPECDKQEDSKAETCEQVGIQCMPVLISTDKTEGLLEKKSDSSEENKEGKVEELKRETEEFSVICEKFSQPPGDVKVEKTSASSELHDDVKTIFEKKRDFNTPELKSNDCTINFLLAPSTLQSKYSPMTSESEHVELVRNISSNQTPSVDKPARGTRMFKFSSAKPQEQSKEICFQMEHLFRTERKEDFLKFITQEYNVAIVYNSSILQEFRGTFHPNKLELGTYEKLHLVPKYPDPENISVHLDDCFVKLETLNQHYIRAKFLLNITNTNSTDSKTEYEFEEGVKVPDWKLSNAKNCQTDCIEEEKLQQNVEIGAEKFFNQSDIKNDGLENEECKIEPLKKPDSDPKPSSKNITFDSLQQSSKLQKEAERREDNLIEKTNKSVKDLFYKRKKKVYFAYEKIEKDEDSGKKVFVGSFRTKAELKALSKAKKSGQKTDASFLGEESMGSDKEKNLFLSSSEESFEELVKSKNPIEQQHNKSQPPAKGGRESNKPNETKNLITLHKHKPKTSQVNYNKDERQNIKFQNRKILIQSKTLTPKYEKNSKKLDVDPSLVHSQRLPSNKSRTILIIVPLKRGEKGTLPEIELIPIEPLKNCKKTVKKEEKEYIPCLNCYH